MSTFKHLDELLARFVEKDIAGCGCVVAQRGEVIYERYVGYADREAKLAMDENSIHRLFSTTKVIVCTAAMMLFERGYFLLHDPVSQYLPEFSNLEVVHSSKSGYSWTEPAKQPLLIKHLFQMTTGIPYPDGPSVTAKHLRKIQGELEKKGGYTLGELVRQIPKAPLLFEPGSNWSYGLGHDILAHLIEVWSGKSIEQFLQDELFGPLEMNNTGYHFTSDQQSRMVTLYVPDEQGIKPMKPAFGDENFLPGAAFCGGGAGLFSTPRDYTTFAQMLANGGKHNGVNIIGRKTIELMRSNGFDANLLDQFQNPYTAGYGYGLGVRTMIDQASSNGNSSLGEFGWTGMTGTYVAIDPAEELTIVYMHQRLPNMETEHHLRVRNTVYGCID